MRVGKAIEASAFRISQESPPVGVLQRRRVWLSGRYGRRTYPDRTPVGGQHLLPPICVGRRSPGVDARAQPLVDGEAASLLIWRRDARPQTEMRRRSTGASAEAGVAPVIPPMIREADDQPGLGPTPLALTPLDLWSATFGSSRSGPALPRNGSGRVARGAAVG